MAKNVNSQEPISLKDLHVYLNAQLTGNVPDEKTAKRVERTAKYTTTVSDVIVLLKVLTQHQDLTIAQLMDTVQVQKRVLKTLGATDEMFVQAEKDYFQALKERENAIKEAAEKAAGSKGDIVAEEVPAPKHHVLNLNDDVNLLGD